MPQRRLTIYGAIRKAFGNRLEPSIRPGIAVATPLLVLANALLSSADRALLPATPPLRPLLAKLPQLNAAAQTLAMAHRAFFALLFSFFCYVTPADSAGHSQESLFLAGTGGR